MIIFSASEITPKSTSLLYAIDGAKSWITSKPDSTKEFTSVLSIFARLIVKSSLLLNSLVESGFEIIQLLAPSIAYNKEVDFGVVSDALKVMTDGLKAKTILHTYFGDVSTKIESLLDLPVSGLGFDITTTSVSSIEKHSFADKILSVGIINSFNTAIEKPQECIQQVDEINAETKPKESYVSNNFDLEYVPKEFAMNKISVLGEIARGTKDV